nr:putative heavy metal-associated domain, HMA [Tanacetum cinerariifolium]
MAIIGQNEDQNDVKFACKKMNIVPTTLATFESLTFPLVQEVVLLADFQCERCQDRVADILSRLNVDNMFLCKISTLDAFEMIYDF